MATPKFDASANILLSAEALQIHTDEPAKFAALNVSAEFMLKVRDLSGLSEDQESAIKDAVAYQINFMLEADGVGIIYKRTKLGNDERELKDGNIHPLAKQIRESVAPINWNSNPAKYRPSSGSVDTETVW